MNKKQRNRKLTTQNKRNRIINRRYSSTIKSLSKLFKTKIKTFNTDTNLENQEQLKKDTTILISNLYSVIDKAAKKNVIHKNNAARKKSTIYKIFKKFNIGTK
jgi:small subunit ribosomal protein S20